MEPIFQLNSLGIGVPSHWYTRASAIVAQQNERRDGGSAHLESCIGFARARDRPLSIWFLDGSYRATWLGLAREGNAVLVAGGTPGRLNAANGDICVSFGLHLHLERARAGYRMTPVVSPCHWPDREYIPVPHLVSVRGGPQRTREIVIWELASNRTATEWFGIDREEADYWARRVTQLLQLKTAIRLGSIGGNRADDALLTQLQNRYLSFRFVAENPLLIRRVLQLHEVGGAR